MNGIFFGSLGRVMADTAATGQENQSARQKRGQHLGIVPCAAGNQTPKKAQRLAPSMQKIDDVAI